MIGQTQDSQDDLKQIGKYVVNMSQKLGVGNFGTVYKGYKLQRPEIPLAAKILDMELYQSENHEENQEMLKREIKILKSIRSPYVVEMRDIFRTKNNIYMFLRYANQGDLQQFLRNSPNKKLTEDKALRFFAQMVEGYKILYNNNIIHRDIKPANILIDNDVCMLTDFGLGKIMPDAESDESTKNMTVQGTPFYRAPQLLVENQSHAQASQKCDVWSMGTVLYEMLNGRRPWHATTIQDYQKVILTKPLLFMDKSLSDDVKQFIRLMLAIDETDRLSWQEVFEHPLVINQNIPSAEEVMLKEQQLYMEHQQQQALIQQQMLQQQQQQQQQQTDDAKQ